MKRAGKRRIDGRIIDGEFDIAVGVYFAVGEAAAQGKEKGGCIMPLHHRLAVVVDGHHALGQKAGGGAGDAGNKIAGAGMGMGANQRFKEIVGGREGGFGVLRQAICGKRAQQKQLIRGKCAGRRQRQGIRGGRAAGVHYAMLTKKRGRRAKQKGLVCVALAQDVNVKLARERICGR